MNNKIFFLAVALVLLGAGCASTPVTVPTRESKIPTSTVKVMPQTNTSRLPAPTLDFSLGVCDSKIDPYSQPPAGILKQAWLDKTTLQVQGFLKTYCGGAKITGDFKLKDLALDLYFKITTDGPVTSCLCAHKLTYKISNLEKRDYTVSFSEMK